MQLESKLTPYLASRLVNLAVSPGVKYKQSSMPFVQMENISHFLRACQTAPLSLPPHDVFLTVDLYEAKDPAQVLQCLAAFSRRANAIEPGTFKHTVGPQSKRGVISPSATGSSSQGSFTRGARASSNASDATYGRSNSPSKSSGYSSWSNRGDESSSAPAWNIHQYGYMGGASQGNQGIAFGARRQITTPSPAVPSLAEKEKRRREEEEAIRRQETEQKQAELARQREIEEQEAQAKAEEERRWEEETNRLRENERREMEAEKKRWDDEKRRWDEEEQRRLAEEKEAEERLERERERRREANDSRLNGQFLSQYQAGQTSANDGTASDETPESRRIKELERELELAKERERRYETERRGSTPTETDEAAAQPHSRSRQRPIPVPPKPSYNLSSLEQERRMLRGEWQRNQEAPAAPEHAEESEDEAPPPPPRPLPQPVASEQPALPPRNIPPAPRPLPDPKAYSAIRGKENRTDRFLNSNPAPAAPAPTTHRPQDYSTTSEVDAENRRREASQLKTRAGGWASKSLLEREMERERERQREWEENQQQTQATARDTTLGSAPGQSWDVHQYGYMGGDSQNRGGVGLGVGGARRQIIGPRPPP